MDWGTKAGTNGPAAGGVNIINNNTRAASQSQAPQPSHHLVVSGYEMVGLALYLVGLALYLVGLALRANLAASPTSGRIGTASGRVSTAC